MKIYAVTRYSEEPPEKLFLHEAHAEEFAALLNEQNDVHLWHVEIWTVHEEPAK